MRVQRCADKQGEFGAPESAGVGRRSKTLGKSVCSRGATRDVVPTQTALARRPAAGRHQQQSLPRRFFWPDIPKPF